MNAKQREGMIRFHERAAAAYLKVGQPQKAAQAKEWADKMRKQAKAA